ncbi:hypothetical protein [Streptomyces sp. NPDC001774]
MTSFITRLPGGPLTKAAALVVALAVLGAAVWAGIVVLGPDPACGKGIEERGPEGSRECTGVTDGSYVFADNLREVSARIKTENERIKGEPHVSVAVMLPMAPTQAFEQQTARRPPRSSTSPDARSSCGSSSTNWAIGAAPRRSTRSSPAREPPRSPRTSSSTGTPSARG